ncbi:8-amino-7-oxononanoate synthase [Escherichia coli]|uniref:8-amino-7-oxononanoate synthase n=1 Tax=Escherichia coli TaxID=562 RepID=A0A376JZ96_ECOLX|nr:8-amino-7-oxononanoate synthase [Escherichia coli]
MSLIWRDCLLPPVRGQQLVVTEGVFSMDGDSAPLAEIQQVTQQHNGWLMVDDAHGTGVIGEQGRGSCWLQKVKPELLVVTFGKGFGVSGAAVLCSSTVADLSAAIRPPSYLQHQYAARSGAGITCIAGGHSQ